MFNIFTTKVLKSLSGHCSELSLEHVSPKSRVNVILQYPPVLQTAVFQCFLYGFVITLISDTGGHIVLEWI
jgi:hypothetical protein